jgi:hypothetical protein
MEIAKSRGARETNVPEERSVAVRKDGEPLANAAKRRRQKEAATDEHQVAAGEWPLSPVREELGAAPSSNTDPVGWSRGATDAGRPRSAAVNAGHREAACRSSESDHDFEEILRLEAREMLTGYLRNGTDYLSASTVRRIVQVAGMSVIGSTMAVSRLDREVRRVTTTYPDEDPAELAESMVQMCEEKVLDWMRTWTVHPGSDADPDPAGGPTGQKLVEALEDTLAKEEAAKYLPPGSRDATWMLQVLEQATKVLCLAEEVCDTTTKGDWKQCAYHNYRWQMDQEVGHLCALFCKQVEVALGKFNMMTTEAELTRRESELIFCRSGQQCQYRR